MMQLLEIEHTWFLNGMYFLHYEQFPYLIKMSL